MVDDLQFEAAASVTVNGHYAGGFIGRPLRMEITACVQPGVNVMRMDPFSPKSARVVVYPR